MGGVIPDLVGIGSLFLEQCIYGIYRGGKSGFTVRNMQKQFVYYCVLIIVLIFPTSVSYMNFEGNIKSLEAVQRRANTVSSRLENWTFNESKGVGHI